MALPFLNVINMRVLTIISIALLCFSASCKKKNKCARAYILEHPMSVYPIQESYNIGDTIWIEMNFPDVFTLWYTKPTNTEEYLTTSAQLKNFDFRQNFLKIYNLINPNEPADIQEYGWDSFEFDLTEGSLVSLVSGGVVFKPIYQNGFYALKASIICQQSGLFHLYPFFLNNNPSSNFGANAQDITPECENESIRDIHYPINRQSDGSYLTNYHIFEEYMNPALETDLDRIKNRCFTFKVN